MEVETLIHIAHRLSYLGEEDKKRLLNKTDEIGKMISGLKRSLNEA
jgi:four helix bundle protein